MIGQFKSKQFFAFVVTGGVAAAFNFGARILYSQWFDFSTAIIIAYITGMVTAFVLSKAFVFKASSRVLHQSALYFVMINLFAVAQTWLVSMGLYYHLLPAMGVEKFSSDIAHGIGLILPVFSSYLGHKHLSFR